MPRPRPGKARPRRLVSIIFSLLFLVVQWALRCQHGSPRAVTDPADAGYVVKHKDGRRNRYQVQAHFPRPDPSDRKPVIGEVLAVLISEAAAAS